MSATKVPIAESIAPTAASRRRERHPHVVQFYAEDELFLDALGEFVGRAVGEGEAAVVIATKAHRDGLAQRLKARGLHTAGAIEKGRYASLDAADTLSMFMVDRWPDKERFAEALGGIIEQARAAAGGEHARVSAFGEMVSLLWAAGELKAAIRLEQLWNELARRHVFSLRCAYPMRNFDREEHGELFLNICAEHSSVIPDESYTSLCSEDERLRNITLLQHKARALEIETAVRKDAEKSLQRRGAELADVLENAVEGVQLVGANQKILWANKALLKLLGYTAEEYINRPLAHLHTESGIFDQFWEKLLRREDIYDYPAEMRCKDGSIKQVLIHSNGLWEGDQFVHARCFLRDVSEQKRSEQALLQAHRELEIRVHERTSELVEKNLQVLKQAEILEVTNQGLRDLSARLMQVQDEERRRIARDLHDSTGQSLALLGMNLSALELEAQKISPDLVKPLSENAEIVRQISTELRTISYLLHPPLLEEMGLESALRWYIDGFVQRSGIQVNLDLPGDLERLPRELEIAIFRVVQECLTNVHRHSGSPTAEIRVRQCSGKVILEVNDEGKGMPPDKLSRIASVGVSGVGLRGMQERIKDFRGELEITSREKGIQIKIAIPVAATEQESELPEIANNMKGKLSG